MSPAEHLDPLETCMGHVCDAEQNGCGKITRASSMRSCPTLASESVGSSEKHRLKQWAFEPDDEPRCA